MTRLYALVLKQTSRNQFINSEKKVICKSILESEVVFYLFGNEEDMWINLFVKQGGPVCQLFENRKAHIFLKSMELVMLKNDASTKHREKLWVFCSSRVRRIQFDWLKVLCALTPDEELMSKLRRYGLRL